MRERSPMAVAIARHCAKWPVRLAFAFLITLIAGAIYAPFLCGETALFWKDASGWSFPVLADMFNRWSYYNPHDLFFNLLAFEIPPMLAVGFFFRNRLPFSRWFLGSLAVVVLSMAICWIPWMPSEHGAQAPWRKRAFPQQTFINREQATFAIFPIIPHRFDANVPGATLVSPGSIDEASGRRFWLGTDSSGKDVVSQLMFGARISLTVGLVATGISMLIGVLLGAMSGYFGGWVDLVIQRLVEIMMSFPTLILILVVVAMLGRDIFLIMTVIGLTGWAGTTRLVRGEFLSQSVREYVLAAETLGLSRMRIMFRHILPNVITPLLISATFGIAGAVGSESALAFIGLGDVTVPSWGVLMEQGRQNIRYGWLIYAPGIAIFAIVTALNIIGNALREALDPKSMR
jgi:peptide/nickel transport system permease protein